MKKPKFLNTSCTILFLLFLTANLARGQYISTRIDLVGLFRPDFRALNVSLEAAFAKHFSFNLGFEHGKYASGYEIFRTLQNNNTISEKKEVYTVFGWALRPELRYYPFLKIGPAP